MDAIRKHSDVILIGAGIMSATLGMLLKELIPDLNIHIYERLNETAAESSDAWNNAGTGHSAFCELNYTPEKEDKSIDISKALKIASSYEISKQYWSYLVKDKKIIEPKKFINSVPHMSFVWGDDNVHFLNKRFEILSAHPLFYGMQYSKEWHQLEQWMPLIMKGRNPGIETAATRMEAGTDVNFGALTKAMLYYLKSLKGVKLFLNHEVSDIERAENGQWNVTVKNLALQEKTNMKADFVFIGAGGGSLPLLEKSNIKEAEGYGGFPVSGQWLRCTNEKIIERHHAKVYGLASVGAPPMSVPHLDTRIIDGKKALLFGPYAGFSTKFLKNGSFWDLAGSIELDNIIPMLSAGAHNLSLTKYLIQQASQSQEDRIDALKIYLPEANAKDWELEIAGQRVQVIKKDKEEGGILEFGTEIVCAEDGSLAALLGASPGASVSVSVILEVLNKCFKKEMATVTWKNKLRQMIPTYGELLKDNPDLCYETRKRTHSILELNLPE
ncbi:MAG: malate:quinone oxidoreductase [Bacteroidota bacterium]